MAKIEYNQFRTPLVNKRGTIPTEDLQEVLHIKPISDTEYQAILNESIWGESSSNFTKVTYASSPTDTEYDVNPVQYTVSLTSALIVFNSQFSYNPNYTYRAYYKGAGSIVWVEDVTSLQTAATTIDSNAIYKDGSVSMTADLNLGTHNITNVGTVDSIDISAHKHLGTSNNDAPQLGTASLENSAVTTVKIANDAVTNDKIADNAIEEEQIKDGEVKTAKLDDYAVTTLKLNSEAVTVDKLASNAVTNVKVADNTIEFSKLNATSILNTLYPVGSIYIGTTATCPIAVLGGTWELIKDKFLLGAGDTYSLNSTGGEAAHTLTINEMPSHSHALNEYHQTGWQGGTTSTGGGLLQTYTGHTGGGQAHNNMPPYIVVNIWKRTA